MKEFNPTPFEKLFPEIDHLDVWKQAYVLLTEEIRDFFNGDDENIVETFDKRRAEVNQQIAELFPQGYIFTIQSVSETSSLKGAYDVEGFVMILRQLLMLEAREQLF